MSVSIDLSDKVALVTGGSQEIGAQMARTFHRAGASVVINHPDIGPTRADADKIAAELNGARPKSAAVIAADVSNAQAVERMMQEANLRFGGIDFLLNNAAILRDRTIAKMSLDEWNSVIGVNL